MKMRSNINGAFEPGIAEADLSFSSNSVFQLLLTLRKILKLRPKILTKEGKKKKENCFPDNIFKICVLSCFSPQH